MSADRVGQSLTDQHRLGLAVPVVAPPAYRIYSTLRIHQHGATMDVGEARDTATVISTLSLDALLHTPSLYTHVSA